MHEIWHGFIVQAHSRKVAVMSELKFPVLKNIPPLPPVTRDEYLDLVEEACKILGPERMMEASKDKDVPVRFRLIDGSDQSSVRSEQ